MSPGHTPSMQLLAKHILADDPDRKHRINANSFQQDAIVNHNGWQYVCFYTQKDTVIPASGHVARLLVNLSRRRVASNRTSWESLTIAGYEQVFDDGHNTISMGICHGDGTIHVSFDHHCDPLRFCISQPGLANDPAAHEWRPALFGPIRNSLPGSGFPAGIFSEVTYPRFLPVGNSLLLSYRIGKAGHGSDVLFSYNSHAGQFDYLGQFLTGLGNSMYINGISYSMERLHVSGCFRRFVEYEGANDPPTAAHKQQAGPNGPENNHDLFYTLSDDGGKTWQNTNGNVLASLEDGETILPDANEFVVFDIPINTGVLNSEGQACDETGGFHVLNREKQMWIHYHRSPAGTWSKHPLVGHQATAAGSRGSIIAIGKTVVIVLPGNNDDSLTVVACNIVRETIGPYSTLWQGEGFDGEPHLDTFRRGEATVLSIHTRTASSLRKVVVLDFVIR